MKPGTQGSALKSVTVGSPMKPGTAGSALMNGSRASIAGSLIAGGKSGSR